MLPRNKPLSNLDLYKFVKLLKIPNFRGIFMRDNLPKKIKQYESGIINLDRSVGEGTHWTAYIKQNKNIVYFDSFGNLPPPMELITYFFSDGSQNKIVYNHDRYQSFDSFNCGHLCLKFLYNNK